MQDLTPFFLFDITILFQAKLKMKTEDPPFDPPYVSVHQAEGDMTYCETLADGSTRFVSAAQAGWMQAGESGTTNTRSPKLARLLASGSKTSSQGKVFLNVPFAEKDQAKALGARWDATRKKWYVPQGVEVDRFGRWMAD